MRSSKPAEVDALILSVIVALVGACSVAPGADPAKLASGSAVHTTTSVVYATGSALPSGGVVAATRGPTTPAAVRSGSITTGPQGSRAVLATASACPTARATPWPGRVGDTSTWLAYTDDAHGFDVRYPPEWVVGVLSRGEDLVIVGFGPPGEENVWTATYTSEIPAEMKPGAPGIGKQFRDRVVTRETVVLNEYAAELVTVTTCQLLDWYDQVVVVEQPPGYIVLTNGAIRDDRFEGFYRSLRMRRRGS